MSTRGLRTVPVSRVCPAAALVWALLGSAALGAQEAPSPGRVTVEGEVVDRSSNLPVEGAIVGLPGLGLNAVTDEMGYYRIDDVPAGAYAVRVLRLGYERFEAHVPVSGAKVLALYLTPGPIPLEGIEVTVVGLEDLEWRSAGTSAQAFIGVPIDPVHAGWVLPDQYPRRLFDTVPVRTGSDHPLWSSRGRRCAGDRNAPPMSPAES